MENKKTIKINLVALITLLLIIVVILITFLASKSNTNTPQNTIYENQISEKASSPTTSFKATPKQKS